MIQKTEKSRDNDKLCNFWYDDQEALQSNVCKIVKKGYNFAVVQSYPLWFWILD